MDGTGFLLNFVHKSICEYYLLQTETECSINSIFIYFIFIDASTEEICSHWRLEYMTRNLFTLMWIEV